MDFGWTKEQLARRAEVVEFAQTQLGGDLIDGDQNCTFQRDDWQKCADFGLQGLITPEEYGGRGVDIQTAILMFEGFGYGCSDTGLTFAVLSQALSAQPVILKFGTEEQKKRYLPALCSGGCAAFAITEQESGSDTYSMKGTATKQDDGYVLNAHKKFITLGPVADVAVIFATVNPELGRWGVSAFLVERDTKGFRATPTRAKMGLRTTPIGDLILEDCFVPEENRLGPEGVGVSVFTTAMESERSYILAAQLGAMERQLENSIEYAKSRRQFGQSIGKFHSVAARVADMKLRLETAKLLLHKVAWLESRGEPLLMEAALAKLHLSECFVNSSLDTIRNHGARGYLTEYEVERDLRDGVGGLIYSGTSDVQRAMIARLLGL